MPKRHLVYTLRMITIMISTFLFSMLLNQIGI